MDEWPSGWSVFQQVVEITSLKVTTMQRELAKPIFFAKVNARLSVFLKEH
jgi:hypothetical protein